MERLETRIPVENPTSTRDDENLIYRIVMRMKKGRRDFGNISETESRDSEINWMMEYLCNLALD